MNWFNNLKIRGKLLVIFIIMIGMTLVVGVFSIYSQINIGTTVDDMIDVSVQKAELSMEIEIAMLQARRSEKDYMLRYKDLGFEEARSKYVAQVQDNVSHIKGYAASISSLEDHQ